MLRDEGCSVRYLSSRVRRGTAIAWGNRVVPPWVDEVRWINHPTGIHLCADKLSWAQLGLGLEWTTDIGQAREWAAEEGGKVICRTILNGHGGTGIVIARNPSQVIEAPLYTKYFKKNREYRVVYNQAQGVVYVASKRLKTGTCLDRDSLLIRTKEKGFTYQIETNDSIEEAVLSELRRVSYCLMAWKLQLLAYDIAYNSETDQAVIIEANTAWGLNPYSAALTVAACDSIAERM
jgi:hypothetical protein